MKIDYLLVPIIIINLLCSLSCKTNTSNSLSNEAYQQTGKCTINLAPDAYPQTIDNKGLNSSESYMTCEICDLACSTRMQTTDDNIMFCSWSPQEGSEKALFTQNSEDINIENSKPECGCNGNQHCYLEYRRSKK